MTWPDDWPLHPIARRYRVEAALGSGGQGRVFSARDELTGRTVAVKLVQGDAGRMAAQREIAVLTRLRLPAVARLLDHGWHEDQRYLVTELVEGTPWPGVARPATWGQVRDPLRQLLRALWQVHDAGIVHGDLKPGNVLVTASGRVVLLDFGLAHAATAIAARSLAAGTQGNLPAAVGGTLHYLSPELIDGHKPRAQADLFSVGVLLERVLTGGLPWPADTLAALRLARAQGPARLPSDLGVHVPDQVERALASLLALDPARRPQTCRDALSQLGLDDHALQLTLPWAPSGPPLEPAELRGVFCGHDRVLHLPEDAAAVLFARTGGQRLRVQQELDEWVDSGLALVEGAYLRMDGDVIAHLRHALPHTVPPPSASEADGWQALSPCLELGGTVVDVVNSAKMMTLLSLDEGRLHDTLAVAELAFGVLREHALGSGRGAQSGAHRVDGLGYVVPLLGHYARAAVGTSSPQVMEHAAWELRRLPAVPGRQALAAVVDAMRLAVTGHPQGALELAVTLPPLGDEPVAALVPAVQVRAAHALPLQAENFVLRQVHAWVVRCGSESAKAREALWLGHLRQRQQLPAAAAALFSRAARHHPDRAARREASLARARAMWQLGDVEAAWRLGRRTLREAASARDARREAASWSLLRELAYHQSKGVGPDVELVDAIHSLGEPLLSGRAALVEAAIGWQEGFSDTAAVLAMRARAAYDTARRPALATLAAALAAVCGDSAGLWWAREHFTETSDPEQAAILLQAAALLTEATERVEWLDLCKTLARATDPSRVGEVLSPAQALRLAGGDPATVW